MEFFAEQWASYRAIVDHDLMEHRAIAATAGAAIAEWLVRRRRERPGAPAPAMVDLGCGDLALLAPLLRRLPLGSYRGLDLTPAVLPLARASLGDVPYPTHWQEGDLLAWATEDNPADPADAEGSVDLLHSSFAIHHLNEEEKDRFLQAARRKIRPGGMFLWADVFRRPGEERATYIHRYSTRIQEQWEPLSQLQKEQAITHLSLLDQPADRTTIQQVAEAAGWQWQWLWRGQHESEALAQLTLA